MDDATPVKTTNKALTGVDIDILSKKTNTKPDPKKDEDEFIKRYDVNDDGYVNVFDIVDLAKAIVGQYEKEGFDKDLSQYKNRKLEEKI